TLFDTVRHWAYSAIREHRGKTWEQWYNSVLKNAQNVNMMFSEPLPYSEIKATAKSIAKYCWKNDAYHYNEFIYRQALKGRKGGKICRRKPVAISARTQQRWGDLGISQSTYYRHKKAGKI
ncbi:primase C-terminal domain-containing protein, partial [Psychrobacter sp. NZS113]|uniref:primase C-terminal domain-containing protein n=1 Tax=Psychrobacter sp. NZS113 TaxID=2792045 RepID=UPI0018CE9BF0